MRTTLVEETFSNSIHEETLLNSTEVTDQEDMNISGQECGCMKQVISVNRRVYVHSSRKVNFEKLRTIV